MSAHVLRNRLGLPVWLPGCVIVQALGFGSSALAQATVEMPAAPEPGDVLAVVQLPCNPENGPFQLYSIGSALPQALESASEAGIAVAGSPGSSDDTNFPASLPTVIGVNASHLSDRVLDQANYGNLSPTTDVLAPGGSVNMAGDGSDYLEGLLEAAIDPADPQFTYYAPLDCIGTSQASTIVEAALLATKTTDAAALMATDLPLTLGLVDGNGQISIYELTLTQPSRTGPEPDVSIGPPGSG